MYRNGFRADAVSPIELQELRNKTLNLLYKSSIDVASIVRNLPFAQVAYLLCVYWLEMFRIQTVEEPSIKLIFGYLNEPSIQKEKSGLWQCFSCVAEKVFDKFLSVQANREKDTQREQELEQHSQFLLVQFNHVNRQIRKVADKFLSDLVCRFPHLLWSRTVLHTMLDILEVLLKSLDDNPNLDNGSAAVTYIPYVIQFMDSRETREAMVQDYSERCFGFLQEAMKWAPQITRSHLEEYANLNSNDALQKNSHLVMATEGLLQFAGLSLKGSETSLEKRPECVKSLAKSMSSFSMRNHFLGQVRGMLQIEELDNVVARLVARLSSNKDSISDELFEETIWIATSLCISLEKLNRSLLHAVCWAPTYKLTEGVLASCCECWQWLISARKDLVLVFMQEMFASWQRTLQARLGVFSTKEICSTSPLAAYGGCDLTRNIPDIIPHDIWSTFICQVVENSKGFNDDLVEMFLYMINRTFPVTLKIGTQYGMVRLIQAIRPRFRLLSCALGVLQDDSNSSRHSELKKWIVRERIYAACFDYFCQGYSVPSAEPSGELKKDLEVVLKFWQMLRNDKKYIIKEDSQNGKELLRKRNLILELLAHEIDVLMTWHNPLNAPDLMLPGEPLFLTWRARGIRSSDKMWRDSVRLAWEIHPLLAIYLPHRLKSGDRCAVIKDELGKLVRADPDSVMHLPEALIYLVTSEAMVGPFSELSAVLTWAPCSPIEALSFFGKDYPSNPLIAQYAVRTLASYSMDTVLFYIPQLVQSLRQDKMGYVQQFVMDIAKKSQLVAHQLIWNMKTNMFLDDESHNRDPEIANVLESLIDSIVGSLSGNAKSFYEREFSFLEAVTAISGEIRKYPKGPERNVACIEELAKIEMQHGCYLPSNPEALVLDIDRESGTPMQSAAKAPFLARFKVKRCGIKMVESIGLGDDDDLGGGGDQMPNMEGELWQAAIFKVGDDVRQDMLALQVISLFKNIFEQDGLDLFLFPYRILATAPGTGVIECVPNAKSRDQLGRQTDITLYDYFKKHYGDENTRAFQAARRNFIKSMAAYSVLGFLLQIKDRHNGNIMIDADGHIIHIDFGFMFESSPGGNLGFEPDIKLTEEMVMIMGGKMEAPQFRWFMNLCVKAYLAVRPYSESIVSLVSLMLDTGLPCFRGQTIRLLRQRFSPELSEREAAQFMLNVINNSFLSIRTKTYDMIQFYQNQIPI